MAGSGALRVHVSHAEGLLAADEEDGMPSPFVVVTVGGRTEQTGTISKTLSPRFEWDFRYRFAHVSGAPSSSVEFDVMDAESSVSLGWVMLELTQFRDALISGERVSCTLQLEDGQEETSGQLFCSFTWEADPVTPKPPPKPEPPVPYTPAAIRTPARVTSFDRRQSAIRVESDHARKTDGSLLVNISHALNLNAAAAGDDGLTGPFVRVSVGGCTEQTRTVRPSLNPRFDWTIRFRFANCDGAPSSNVAFEVVDGDDEWDLGTAMLALSGHRDNLAAGARLACTLPLDDGQAKPGSLLVSFTWEPDDGKRYYPPAPLPVPLPPPKPPPPRRKTSGCIRVRVHDAAGLKTMAKGDKLTTFLIKVTLGARMEKICVVKDSQHPHFDSDVRFTFDHVLIATSGSIGFEAFDWDRVGWDDPLGRAAVALEPHREDLTDGELADCSLKLDDGQETPGILNVSIAWEYDEPPTPRERKYIEPTGLPELDAEPSPNLMLGLFFGVPLVTGYLAYDAEYGVPSVSVSILMPIIAMVAYLVTPLTPPEDPSEPPFPTLENMLPGPLYTVIGAPINFIFAAKDFVKAKTLGVVMAIVGPWIAPYMSHIAYGIQITMGVTAAIEAEEGLAHVTRFGAGVIIFIMTAIQVPDSFSWAFTRFPKLQAGIDRLYEKQAAVEGSVTVAADEMMQQIQELTEDAKDSDSGFQLPPTPDFFKPIYRAFCEWLDGIGSLARASPFKLLVVILELSQTVDGMAMPDMNTVMEQVPDLPSWDQLESMWNWLISSLAAVPTAWPTFVLAHHNELLINSTALCQPHEPCQVLGPVGSCNSTTAWFPSSVEEATKGISLVYEPPLPATEILIHYQLVSPPENAIAFSLRLELSDETSTYAQASSEALAHWEKHGLGPDWDEEDETHGRVLQHGRLLQAKRRRRRKRNGDVGEANATTIDFAPRVYLMDVFTHPGGGMRNITTTQISSMTAAYPPSFAAFETLLSKPSTPSAKPLHLAQPTCALPLQLVLEDINGTYPHLLSLHVSLHSASGHAMEIGIDGVQLIGDKVVEEIAWDGLEEMEEPEDDDGGDDGDAGGDDAGAGDSGGGSEHHAGGGEEIPVGEIAGVVGVGATAAASTDFVRSQVKPEEFAKGQAKESAKKEAQLARSGAEGLIRKLLATPLPEVNVAEALAIIDEAEQENVLASLIDKAVDHTEKAAQLQFNAA